MNEQTKNIVLSILIGLVAGIGLLVGLSAIVTNSLTPVMARGESLASSQARIEHGVAAKLDKLETMVDSLKSKVDSLDMKLATARLDVQRERAPMPQQPMPQQPMPPQEDPNKVYNIPVGDSYILGKKDAPITIVEFSDFQCPFCSRFHTPARDAQKAYPDKVKLVIKSFPLPFHPNARPAAKAALAAGAQGKYFEMVDLLLENQQDLSDAKYLALAKQLGLNVDKFTKDLKDKDAEWEKRLAADMSLVQSSDVQGTPTYFLNGKKSNARTVEAWKSEIDALLKK